MLSIFTLKDSSAASQYYEVEDYYAKDSPEAIQATHWYGKGAEVLGLSGYVDKDTFKNLLEGVLPSGQQLGRKTEDGIEHRPGYDLTFSAPKSVSMLSEIAGDKRLHDAHDKAVNAALNYLQSTVSQTRAMKNGALHFEQTDNLTIAKFRHNTTRELDPSLHTHCVILNMVMRKDGEWRSLSSENIYTFKMLGGLIYRAALAYELKKLGYELEFTRGDGLFEIEGFSREEIELFSKRRVEIEKVLKERNWSTAKESEMATLFTRDHKIDVDKGKLMDWWQVQANDSNLDLASKVDDAKQREIKSGFKNLAETTAYHSKRAVAYAIAHLCERNAVFQEKEIINTTLKYALGDVTLASVQQAILESQLEQKILKVGVDLYTTEKGLQMERDVIERMEAGKGYYDPLASPELASLFSEARQLSHDKRQALMGLLTCRDRIVGLQGSAGAGKTTLVKLIREYALAAGYEIEGVVYSASAADVLAKRTLDKAEEKATKFAHRTGMKTSTLERFLAATAKQATSNPKRKLLIVDEASMVSTRQMQQLLKRAERDNLQIILVGDTKQLAAIEAGAPYILLQNNGIYTAYLHVVERQKNKSMGQIVAAASRGEIEKAFEKLGTNIYQIEGRTLRLEKLAEQYLSLSYEEQDNTLVLVPRNEDRKIVNGLIHSGLIKQGRLQGEEADTFILIRRGFTHVEQTHVHNYDIGNYVRFNRHYKSLGITAGDYCKVNQIYRKADTANQIPANTIELITPEGKRVLWNPDKVAGKTRGAVEIYEAEARTLLAGNKIRWTKNDYANNIINSQFATVLQVENAKAVVELADGNQLTLDLNQHTSRHWEHAYATTIHNAQGLGGKTIIGNIDSSQKNLSTLRAFYVLLSRAEENAYLFVDDIKKVIETIKTHSGEKLNALEVLHYYEELEQIELTIKNAPEKIQENIYELNDNYQRYMAIAEHYISLNPQARDNALCLINNATARQTVNQLIRMQMHKQGELEDVEITAKGLIERDLRDTTRVTAYQLGNVVCFHKNYSKLGVQAQEHLTIVAIDEMAGIMTLARVDGSTLQWQPALQPGKNKHYDVSLYYTVEQPLCVGDKIRFTKDNKVHPFKKGQSATVTSLTDTRATLRLKNGQTTQLDLTQLNAQHWTYHYCQGLYDTIRKIPQHVIALFDEQIKSAHQQRKLLSIVGQAKKSACVYTHSEAFVLDKVKLHTQVELASRQAHLNQDLYELTSQVVGKWQSRLQVIPEQEKRQEALIQAYFKQTDAAILAVTLEERYQLSQAVRERLKDNILYGHEIIYQALVHKPLSKEALGYATFYQAGDIIHFTKDYPLLAIKGDVYYKINAVDIARNEIELFSDDQTLRLAASQLAHKHRAVSLYQLEERPLMQGDTLRFTQGDKFSQVGKVTAVSEQSIEVTTVTGELHRLASENMEDKHWEYDYLASMDNASGHKKSLLVAYPEGQQLETARTLYHLLNKTKKGVIYVANKEDFTSALTNEKDYAVLGLLQRYEVTSKASKQAWSSYFNEKEQGGAAKELLSQAKILQRAIEEQAYHLLQTEVDEALIKALGIDKERLYKQASQHERVQLVDKFLQETRPLHRERLAYSIAQQLSDFYPLLAERHVDIQHAIFKAANQHKRRLESIGLSVKERQYKRQVEHYYQSLQQAGRYWQEIYTLKESKRHVPDYLVQRANSATLQRNQLAYFLYHYPERYQRYLRTIEKSKQLIEKHGLQHVDWIKNQAKRQQDLQTRDWKYVLKFEQQLAEFKQIDTPKKAYWDKQVVLDAAMPHAEKILTELVGSPINSKLSRGNQLVWGNKGSVTLHTHGVKAGLISDFENGFHGDLVTYVARRRGISWQQAVDELAQQVGLSPILAGLSSVKPASEMQQNQAAKEKAKRRERAIQCAERLWNQSIPITNTLAEQYLRKHRALTMDLSKAAMRFHPKALDYEYDGQGNFMRRVYRPALIVAGHNEQGKVVCVQTTYLDEKTANKNKALNLVKRTHGSHWGYAVKIQEGKTNQVIFTESVETAVSLAVARPNAHIYASLGNSRGIGNLAYVAKQLGAKEVLLAADNDEGKTHSRSWEDSLHAADQLSHAGLKVLVVKPDLLPGEMSTDFNDLLKTKGIDAVKETLEKAYCLAHAKEFPAEPGLSKIQDTYIPDIIPSDITSDQSYDYLAAWLAKREPSVDKPFAEDDGVSI